MKTRTVILSAAKNLARAARNRQMLRCAQHDAFSFCSHLRSSAFICGFFVVSAASAQGLQSLNDDAVLTDLARRNQTALLERAFVANNTPADKRDAIRATADLARLRLEGRRMSGPERAALTARVIAGINSLLPTMTEPRRLTQQADALLESAVAIDVNTLEYWGPSVGTQAQLKPVVETVIRLLDKAATISGERLNTVAASAAANDAAATKQLDELEQLGQVAEQTKALANYYLALCYDPADPNRAKTASEAIAYLEGFDVEGNPARPNLKIVLGKLYAVRGDFDKARGAFEFVANNPTDEKNDPKQFEARYFRAVVDVLAKDPRSARAQYDALLAWEKDHPSNDPSIGTANALLDYRITSIEPGDASKTRATALLIDLLNKRPDLQAPIMTQLRAGIGADTPVASLEPLLLQALVSDAQEQVLRSQRDALFKPDPKVLERGLDAANELIARAGKPGVDDRLVGDATFLVPVFLETLDRKVEAAGKYLDYAAAHKDKPEPATAALTNAQRLFAQLGGLKSEDTAVTSLYDRIVPLALGMPFDQKELAYDWAVRLQQHDKPDEAAAWFRKVPSSDSRYATSRYYLMVALSQSLEKLKTDDARVPELAREIQTLADEVHSVTHQAIASAKDERARLTQRQRLARTALLASSVARTQQNDPKRALALLDDFESLVAGSADENALVGEAMFTRVQANMQLGNTDAAVKDLVQLLDRSGGAAGAQIVFNMLTKLERDFDQAQANNDHAAMVTLQANRATLTPYLVTWAEKNSNPEIKKFAYSYAVYDAETQRIAAELTQDPTQKADRKKNAMSRFVELDSEAGRKRYAASRDPALGPAKFAYDPQVQLGIARLKYDTGDWPAARDAYAKLLADRALGTAIATVRDAGGNEKQVDNDAYWEATLRLIDAKVKAGDEVEPLKVLLREQMIRWGDRVGGTKWRSEFESLRQSLIPDFKP